MSGNITDYSIAPVSIQATNSNVPRRIASANPFKSITVNVKYVYDADKKLSFEQSFTEFQNFSGDIAPQEQTLILAIVNKLTEDIFNKAFANWN